MERKDYYTKDELYSANQQNILHTLKSMNYELKNEGTFYRGVTHSSLIIRNNGQWAWNSKDLRGKAPVELLKQILIHDYNYDEKSAYITAIKQLAGTQGQYLKDNNYSYSKTPKPTNNVESITKVNIVLPPKNENHYRLTSYLCNTRGLDANIIKDLILQNKIYETQDHHNVCFVTYDKENNPKHAFMRGTLTGKVFKKDILNSDKTYGFLIDGYETSNRVFCFESSIDCISNASLYKLADIDYKEAHRISLHGTSFLALEKFLEENPNIEEIVSCLDNDETGIRRSKKLCEEFYEKGYKTFIQPPKQKDYNEQLLQFLQRQNEVELEEFYERG